MANEKFIMNHISIFFFLVIMSRETHVHQNTHTYTHRYTSSSWILFFSIYSVVVRMAVCIQTSIQINPRMYVSIPNFNRSSKQSTLGALLIGTCSLFIQSNKRRSKKKKQIKMISFFLWYYLCIVLEFGQFVLGIYQLATDSTFYFFAFI